jgi:acetyl-CoA carboxylase carboxyl transferase subunit alpha
LENGLIDEIIPEPLGGAHRNPQQMAEAVRTVINRNLKELKAQNKDKLLPARYEKFRSIGKFV